MNKLFTKIVGACLGLTMAVGVGIALTNSKDSAKVYAAAGDEHIAYTLNGSTTGSGNAYAGNNSATVDGIAWTIQGNAATQPWRLGGKLSSATDRAVYSNASLASVTTEDISKVVVTLGTKQSQITVNSVTIKVGSSANSSTESTETISSNVDSSNAKITFNRPANKSWASKFFSFVLNLSSSASGSNYYVQFAKAEFYYIEQTPAATYTVSFNKNGGTGNMNPVTDVSGSYTLPANGFTAPDGKVFAGWKANNAGETIAAGGSYTVDDDVTFYAQWADAYTVTYTAGANGSGSYAHTLQPAGTYTLLQFASLTGVSASSGYRFKNYTVGGVNKNPNQTFELSAATSVTVNFELIPEETTYNFAANYSTYASAWNSTYGSKTLAGTTDVGGDYAATIVLARANKQSSGVGSDKPYICGNTNADDQMITFTLTETGKKIKDVTITFEQRGSNAPVVKLFKGNSASGSALDTATIGTKNTLSTSSSLNDTAFSVTLNAGGTSNKGVALTSIYITIENQASYGTTNHITVTSFPNTIYHIGETYDGTGLAVTAYDGSDETTANFKDVTASVTTRFTSGAYVFDDNDVPTTNMWVEYEDENNSHFYADDIVMHVYALAEYKLVESAPADWSGNYLIVSADGSGDLHAMNGALVTIDVEGNHKTATDTSGIIENGQELEFTIASYSTGYSIQGKSGKYIGWGSGSNNGLTGSDTALVNTLAYSDGGVVISGSGGRQLNFNTDGEGRFRYYTSGKVQLYKLVESDDASDFADMFLETLSTGASAVCQYNETTHEVSTDLDDLKQAWKDLADLYSVLSAADKEQFRLGVASEDPNATNIAKALALYDFVAAKYNTKLQGTGFVSDYDFMNRDIAPMSNARILESIIAQDGTITSIIVIISMISLTAIGGYLFLRKRKENN